VRLERDAGRLKAFVVPAGDADVDGLAAELDRWCGDKLTAVERPRRWAVGGVLPVNGMGKLEDW
jgi:acyl-coenzyme A synthetase/AMP-(fatty) acid ligase